MLGLKESVVDKVISNAAAQPRLRRRVHASGPNFKQLYN